MLIFILLIIFIVTVVILTIYIMSLQEENTKLKNKNMEFQEELEKLQNKTQDLGELVMVYEQLNTRIGTMKTYYQENGAALQFNYFILLNKLHILEVGYRELAYELSEVNLKYSLLQANYSKLETACNLAMNSLSNQVLAQRM